MNEWQQSKNQVLARLKRAEGQVRAVQAMVEREDDCEKVAQQLAAARKALDRAFFDIVACIMQRDLTASGALNARSRAQISQMRDLLTRYG